MLLESGDGTTSGGMNGEKQTEHTMDHSKLNTGAKYGDHVSDMAQKSDKHNMGRKGFSGEMNPGKHHQGYSEIKQAK